MDNIVNYDYFFILQSIFKLFMNIFLSQFLIKLWKLVPKMYPVCNFFRSELFVLKFWLDYFGE